MPLELNWKSLADPDTTLVVYMGLVNIDSIVENLMAHGLAGDTSVAIIERGTTRSERVIKATLSALPQQVKSKEIQSPSLLVIGKVASLAIEKMAASPEFAAFFAQKT